MNKYSQASKQQGFTLVEVGIVLIIMTLMVALKIREDAQELRMALAKSQGEQMKVAGKGLYNYALANFNAIVDGTAVAGVANTHAPTVAELKTLGYMESGFNANTFYGGTYNFTINKSPATCTTDCNIAGLAYTSTPMRDPIDNQVDATLLGQAINAIGADGGGSTRTPAAINGKAGGWTSANPAGAVTGILAMRVGEGSALDLSAYLRRDGTRPMTGNLNMGNQSIENLLVAISGAACPDIGALATTANGDVLSCQNGTWQQQGSAYWKDPVGTAAGLPACTMSTIWQTRLITAPTVGTKPIPYSCNGSAWVALMIDDAGNLTVPNTVALGKIQVNDIVAEGSVCATNGLVARDATGLILSCQSGSWKSSGSTTGRFIFQQTYFGSSTRVNNSGSLVFVTAYGFNGVGGTCGNRINGNATVDGIAVASIGITMDTGSKVGSFSFVVPNGSTYSITSNPYGCGSGRFTVSEWGL
ncbi:hypothetical protein ACKF11_13950 [Methylobacillus sp. Pita2]|uniref:type II secretion system protein n=1 Tax=Methylobacillus sp. Pita2 TaxID=3383245 RepID=UPI0038B5D94A